MELQAQEFKLQMKNESRAKQPRSSRYKIKLHFKYNLHEQISNNEDISNAFYKHLLRFQHDSLFQMKVV